MLTRSKTSARILVLILAVATVMAFTPLTGWTQEAYAEGEQTPADQVAVNGASVITGEYWVWSGSSYTTTGATSSNYNIHYTSGTLELKDDSHFTSVVASGGDLAITLDNAEVKANSLAAIEVTDGSLTLTLVGKNIVTNSSEDSESAGIAATTESSTQENVPECSITVSGAGSLSIKGAANALAAENNVTILGGTIMASSPTDNCIVAGDDVSISGGRIVATSTTDTAIAGYGNIAISGGTVIANGLGKDGLAMANGPTGRGVSITGGAVYAHGDRRAMNTAATVTVDA